jgi:DNA-binding SARP family transcriptional activator/predicted ATPase
VAVVPTIGIDLLGGFRVLADGRPIARVPTVRQQQLIAFLILHGRGGPIPRQRISGSLWPESTDVQALTNLRRELHHLREGWPSLDALVDAGSRTLAWRGSNKTVVDLLAFEAAAERGLQGDRDALKKAAALYKGDLLPDSTGEWIEADRDRLRQRAQQVLARLVALLEEDRAYGEAIEHAQQLLRLDPLDEQIWCALMRCHARRGERATALHLYQQCAALLKKELGVQPSAATRLTYREILDLDPEQPAASAPTRTAVYPLAGRQTEWLSLLSAWRTAAAGRTRLCVIRGEAGIGKTRLAEELIAWTGLNAVTALSARCYAGEGRLAYAPIASWLKSAALQPSLMRLDASWLTDVARLHPEILAARHDVPAPDPQLESWQRLRFFEALTRAFRSAVPLVLFVDDLQWADGDTIEWLQYFARSATDTQCLLVGTVRAEEEQDNPPLVRLLRHLEREDLMTAIALGPLDRTATAQLAGEVAEHPLDEPAIARTFRETEGHPLFIVERGRMELATQPGVAAGEALPRVQSVVAARLALLSEDARAAAEVASAVGRDFRFDILAEASDLEEDALVRALDELWRRQIVRVQADERWDFSHDRIREVAYNGIGPARRRLIHRRIAQGMELLWADRLDDVSASIGVHLDRGGQPARAIPFLERAATVAARLSANEEAIRLLNHAVALIEKLPPGRDRDERELALRSSLSVSLNSARGYAAPEVEENLDRVFTLSRAHEGGQVAVRWLWVAFTMRFMLGDLKRTREVSEQALARSETDPSCRCEAHHAMGGTLMSVGELAAAKQHFEAALAAYDENRPQSSALGSDLGVFAHAWGSHCFWLIGDESGAVASAEKAIALAERLDHKYSQTIAHAYAALLHQMRLDIDRVLASAEAAAALCERYGFAYYGDWAQTLIGWVRGRERPAVGIAVIESALERLDKSRAQARRPYYLSLLADTYRRSGNRERASSLLNQAITMALAREETWWLPALYLQKAEFEAPPDRETTLGRALALARQQNSHSLEQRILLAEPVGDALPPSRRRFGGPP